MNTVLEKLLWQINARFICYPHAVSSLQGLNNICWLVCSHDTYFFRNLLPSSVHIFNSETNMLGLNLRYVEVGNVNCVSLIRAFSTFCVICGCVGCICGFWGNREEGRTSGQGFDCVVSFFETNKVASIWQFSFLLFLSLFLLQE